MDGINITSKNFSFYFLFLTFDVHSATEFKQQYGSSAVFTIVRIRRVRWPVSKQEKRAFHEGLNDLLFMVFVIFIFTLYIYSIYHLRSCAPDEESR